MFERFTKKARSTVERAHAAAKERGSGQVGPEHLLLALAAPGSGIASDVLTEQGVSEVALGAELDQLALRPTVVTPEDLDVLAELGIDAKGLLEQVGALPSGGRASASYAGNTPYGKAAKKTLELSLREALRLHDNYIGTEHLLLGLLRQGGVGCDLLAAVGADLDALQQRAEQARPGAA